MIKPIQCLLVGLPYSGKTTLAKKLEERLGFVHINIDQLKFDKGYKDMGDDEVPDKVWEEIFQEADRLIVKYLKQGKNVANEYAWVTKHWRDRARNVAHGAGFETKVILLNVPMEVVKKRWQENQKTRARFDWPKQEFERYVKDFEKPTEEENVIVYENGQDLDQWIKENIISV